MIILAGFLDVLFRALIFIGSALGLGGIIFRYLVLPPSPLINPSPANPGEGRGEGLHLGILCRRAITLILIGTALIAACQLLTLLITPWSLADEDGHWPLAAFLSTTFARASMVRAFLALALLVIAAYLHGHPLSTVAWTTAAAGGAALLASGAYLVHGASRLHDAVQLMTMTVIHQLAATAWIGGAIHLVAQWRLVRRWPASERLWPQLLARFSRLALVSVAVLVAAGMYLYWQYIRHIAGLVGTAYGTMLLTKLALMAMALVLGGLNFLAIRRWKMAGDPQALFQRLPIFIITESGIGITLLMAAAALTGQPPAIDLSSQQATPAEVLHTFAPKRPQLTPAPWQTLLANSTSPLDLYSFPTDWEKVQSDFNHNISGLFVILIGLGALFHRLTGFHWARHWPLLFLPFALFIFLLAEPTVWPLGPEGFFATLLSPEALQHRLAAVLVVALGLLEWRIQSSPAQTSRFRYAFPILCGLGGALLLTHSHSVFSLKWAFLIEVSHNAIGILAVLIAAGRFLELQLPTRQSRPFALLWPICFTLVGLVLLFYRET